MSVYEAIKEEAFEENRKIPELGLAISTFGNVSAFDPQKGVLAIKPSGVPYSRLTMDQMVVVDLDNKVVEGELRPSSDTRTHTVLYRHFKGIRGIVHTHSTYAVAWAQAMRPIPVLGTTHADHLAQDIPVTKVMSDDMIGGGYEEETGNQILDTFQALSFSEIEMVLVACHGPFTWGDSAGKALYNSAALEEVAKMAFLTEQINPEVKRMKKTLSDKHYLRKHGKNAYYGQT
jgi:L-ribulose-5-phosphate 4-epimerase